MSSVFRMVLVSRGARWCAYSNISKFNFNLLAPSSSGSCNCSCETLVALPSLLRRNYSTKTNLKIQESNIETAANDAKTTASDVKSVTGGANINEKESIYTGFLSKNIRNVKLFSLSTSIIGLAMQPLVYKAAVLSNTANNMTLSMFAIVGMFAVATPPLLHIVTKRYVIDVEYDPKEDNYTATTYNIFVLRKKVTFTPEDVTIPAVLGMFTTCAIKGKPIFLDSKSFKDQRHYVRIMGYDKPIDLQTNEDESSDKKNN